MLAFGCFLWLLLYECGLLIFGLAVFLFLSSSYNMGSVLMKDKGEEMELNLFFLWVINDLVGGIGFLGGSKQ